MINRRTFLSSAIALGTVASLGFSAAPAFAGGRKGHFEGRSDHITTGKVKIVKDGDHYVVELGEDFSLDGAPDPRVGLGKDGKYDKDTDLGKLENLNGKQRYTIPASLDISGHNEVYIWCRKFNVPLGVATIH